MITTSTLRNSIGLIAWIGIIRDRGIGVVSRYRRELRLKRLCTRASIHLTQRSFVSMLCCE